ncbi:hypothetical protein SAMN05216563_1149 [Phytobacter palmae]|nr:hypothetical protein SAMN05216563_1149 [Phytobacter palmae]
MAFWDDNYLKEANRIDSFLENKLSYINEITQPTASETDGVFIDRTIYNSWKIFYHLYIARRDALNEYTKFNQKTLQYQARPALDLYKEAPFQFVGILARLLYEFYFWNYDASTYPDILSSESLERLSRLSNQELWGDQFKWIDKKMATSMLRDIMSSDEFKAIRGISSKIEDFKSEITIHIEESTRLFDEKFGESNKKILESLKNIDNYQNQINDYQSKLEDYKSNYNFTLLSRAFNNLKNSKQIERNSSRIITRVLSGALLIPPVFSFFNHIYSWVSVGEGLSSLTYYLPLLTVEILVFYFMRLYYSEVRNINTQLLQIEHRLSLCEFIQDYIEKKNTDKENKESWNLFESLIFAPIQVTPDNIPSVIDGANAVAELAGKIMSKSKD